MRHPFPAFISGALRFHAAAMVLALPLFVLTACDGGKEEETADASSSSPAREKQSPKAPPAEVPKPPEFPPLAEHALGRIADQCVLIRVDGHPVRPGILLSGNHSSSGQYEYQVICDPPAAPKTILCAAISRGDVFVPRAFHMAVMPGGLHVYGFTSDQPLTGHTSRTSLPTGPFYACRLEATGLLANEAAMAVYIVSWGLAQSGGEPGPALRLVLQKAGRSIPTPLIREIRTFLFPDGAIEGAIRFLDRHLKE